MVIFALRCGGYHGDVFKTEFSAIKEAERLKKEGLKMVVEVWIAKDCYAEHGRPISKDDLLVCIWRDGPLKKVVPPLTEITYPARIANKGNTKAVVVPIEVINELDLEVGDMVQITMKKLGV